MRYATISRSIAIACLLAAPSGLAGPLAQQPGIVDVGTLDDDASKHEGGTRDGGRETTSETTPSEWCMIPDPFGGCIAMLFENTTVEKEKEDSSWSYYYENEWSNASGYYADILNGVVYLRVSDGERDQNGDSSSGGTVVDGSRTYYENSLGMSEEHKKRTESTWTQAERHERDVQGTWAEAGVAAPVGGAQLDVTRETRGEEHATRSGTDAHDKTQEDRYLDHPVYESAHGQASSYRDASERVWRDLRAGGSIYLINPVDASTVEIVALRSAKGDASGSGTNQSNASTNTSQGVFGQRYQDVGRSEETTSDYSYVEEWLHLTIDLVEGTVRGDALYSRGSEDVDSEHEREERHEYGGKEVYRREETAEERVHREWRTAGVTLDAANGLAVLDVQTWDVSEDRHETYDRTTTLLVTEQYHGATGSRHRSDGVSVGLDIGGGVLHLGARYENRTDERSAHEDQMVGDESVFGTYGRESKATRGVYLDAGSEPADTRLVAHHEETVRSHEQGLRIGGNELADEAHETRGREEHADATLGGIFVFNLTYVDSTSKDEIQLAGMPLGSRREHTGVGTQGEARDPNGGAHLFSYSFSHEESTQDIGAVGGPDDLTGARHNTTKDSLTILVLDGLVAVGAEREFSNTQLLAGDTEVYEQGGQAVNASVEHGAVDAGPAKVENGRVNATAFLGYVEPAGAIAVMGGLAHWCARPGASLPYETVLGALPREAVQPAGAVIAILAQTACAGVPIVAPIFAASPCILVPVGAGTAFLTTRTATSFLPAGGALVGSLADQAEGRFWNAYDETLGCMWLTIPDTARNPQPALWAVQAVESGDEAVAEGWPVYDGARLTAYNLIDAIFEADKQVPEIGELPTPD